MDALESINADVSAALLDLSAHATLVQISSGAQFRLLVHKLVREFELLVATIAHERGHAPCLRFIEQGLEMFTELGCFLQELGDAQPARGSDFLVLRERLAGLASPDAYLELVKEALLVRRPSPGILSIAMVQAAMLNKALAGETSGFDFVNPVARRRSREIVAL